MENRNSQTEQLQPGSAQTHTRINNTLLGSAERRALQWLAARMPAWIVPDTLTAIGLFASFLIFASYALTQYNRAFLWLASFAFLIQWFGDSLDGTLARYRKIERPRYGFFIDHIVDALSEALIFLGLGLSPYLRFDLALLALCSYLMMSVYVYLVTYVNGVFRISYARLGPTEVRLLAVITNTVVFFTGTYHLQLLGGGPFGAVSLTVFDLVVVVIIALLSYLFIYNTIVTAMALSREDRVAARDRKIQARMVRNAHRKALRDERLMRKAAARQIAAYKTSNKDAISLKAPKNTLSVKTPSAVAVKLDK